MAQADFNSKADAFFSKYITAGKVDYAAVSASKTEMDALAKSAETVDITKLSADELKAFYINAYNIMVIKALSEKAPLPKNVIDIPGFFDAKMYAVGGKRQTLNSMHSYVRKTYNDPRVHFAFVAGAKSSPPLQPKAFAAASLDKTLETAASEALNKNFLKINHDKKEIQLSKIFDWYKEDFGADALGFVKSHLTDATKKKELDDALAAGYKVTYQFFNWQVNQK